MSLKHKLFARSSGAVITMYWSGRGDVAKRKQLFGVRAKATWKAERLGTDMWVVGGGVPLTVITEELEQILSSSDKAVVVFPYGKAKDAEGRSMMSVHTYNF